MFIIAISPSQASGIGLPIGSIIAWPLDTLPSKPGIWLECNGQSCTAYPKLVAVLGSNNVPNYAGVFLRGYGGQAIYHWGGVWHNSANIGELQGDAIRNIIGSFGSEAGVAGDTGNHPATGPFYYRNGYGDHIASNIHSGNNETVFDASRAVPTSNENRPINIAVKWIIKAK